MPTTKNAAENEAPPNAPPKAPREQPSAVIVPDAKEVKAPRTPADNFILDRLKKSGLDPQKLLDLTLPSASKASAIKKRHRIILLGFFLFVAIPSALTTLYMFFVASDQYHSTTAFAVRSSGMTASTDILGMMLDSGSESTTSNSYIVHDYIQSQAMLENLPDDVDLEAIFNREGADWVFRMGSELPIEEQLDFWHRMVDVHFDATSGVIQVEVRTFSPEDSVRVAEVILKASESLVNKLSEASRRQSVKYAEEAVAAAQTRLKVIRREILSYREQSQEVSPEDNARIAVEILGALNQTLIQKQAERTTLLSYLDQESPRIRIINEEIAAIEAQIAQKRTELGAGGSQVTGSAAGTERDSISLRIANYSDLKLEEEFSQQLYTTALAGLEQARKEANEKKMYLATFIYPTFSEKAQYPSRILISFAAFFLMLGLWTVGVLLYYNARDRS